LEPPVSLDVNAARLVHIDWLMSLERAMEQGPDAAASATVGMARQSDTGCALGVWLRGDGQRRYGQFDEIKRLGVAHKKFHRIIDRAVASLCQGERDRVQALIAEARTISKDIVYLLTFIELEIVERERKRYTALHPFESILSLFSGQDKGPQR